MMLRVIPVAAVAFGICATLLFWFMKSLEAEDRKEKTNIAFRAAMLIGALLVFGIFFVVLSLR